MVTTNNKREEILIHLENEYQNVVNSYIHHQDETHLHSAYQLGRNALAQNCTILDLIAIHHDCLILILERTDKEAVLSTTDHASVVLEEALSPFEMTNLDLIESIALLNKRAIDFAKRTQRLKKEIAKRKQAEKELSQLNLELEERVKERTSDLEEANNELESFSYSVSHDLRAPLRHISGFAQLIKSDTNIKKQLNSQNLEYLDKILNSTRKMTDLIDDLLEFSRVGRYQLNKSKINLNRIIDDVISDLADQQETRNITWNIDDNITIYADKQMFTLVMINLISNALKYTRPVKKVKIDIKIENLNKNKIVFYIRDNGVGFNMDYADKLFGVFQRLHAQSEFEGTGIGLANVQRIVKRHGGTIWAEGKIGKGATFYISLPNNKEKL